MLNNSAQSGEKIPTHSRPFFSSRGVYAMALIWKTSGRAVLYITLLLGCAIAQAQTLNTAAAHLKVNFIDLIWRVNADNTTVYEQAVEREALSEQGAQAATK